MPRELLDVPWSQIRPMPDQPREYFDRVRLVELAESIAAIGQTTPVDLVRLDKSDAKGHLYEIIDGQRRWHAVQMADIATLTAVVTESTNAQDRFVRSVVANCCREDLGPLEIARSYERMKETMTVGAIAQATGKSSRYVSMHLGLLKLHPDIQAMLSPTLDRKLRIPYTAAVRLSTLSYERQLQAFQEIRACKAPAHRAVEMVLEGMPPVPEEKTRVWGMRRRTNVDANKIFTRMLSRCLRDVGDLSDDHVGRIMQGRSQKDSDQILRDLKRIEDRASHLRHVIEAL